jgi:hypothetical protein
MALSRRSQESNISRTLHRERTKHQTVYKAEDGGVDANAKGEREYGDDGKAWRFAQHAERVANVL